MRVTRLDSPSDKTDNKTVKSAPVSRHQLSKKALPLFFFGLLISTFVGGAVRAFFSPRQIELWVSKTLEKENPPIHLSFAEGSLSLSHRSIPRLGLVFKQVHVQPKDYCKANADLFVDELYLPIQVFDFMRGQLKFRQIEIHQAELNLHSGDCNRSETDAPKEVAQSEARSTAANTVEKPDRFSVAPALNFLHHRWPKEMQNTAKRVQGLKMAELSVRRGEEPIAKMSDINLITKDPEHFTLAATLKAHRIQGMVEVIAPMKLNLDIDPQVLKFRLEDQIREGRIHFHGEVLLSNLHYSATGELLNVPTRPLYDFVVRNDLAANNLNWPRQSWLSGTVRASGEAEKWSETDLILENFKLDGDLGQVVLKPLSLKPLGPTTWSDEIRIEVLNLKMDPTFELLGVTRFAGVFQSMGYLSGELLLKDRENFEFTGRWKDLALKFSRKNVRETQSFSFNTSFSKKEGRWSAQVDEVDLVGGEFKGRVSLNINAKGEGPLRVEIERLKFSEPVQKLMLRGVGESVEVYGQGFISDSRIEKWEGSMGLSAITAEDWRLSQLKLHSLYRDHKMNLSASLKELWVEPTHPLYAELKRLYLDQEMSGAQIHWSDMQAKVSVENQQMTWTKAMAKDLDKKMLLASEGSWSQAQGVAGWISVDFPAIKLLKWQVSGEPTALKFEPSSRVPGLKD